MVPYCDATTIYECLLSEQCVIQIALEKECISRYDNNLDLLDSQFSKEHLRDAITARNIKNREIIAEIVYKMLQVFGKKQNILHPNEITTNPLHANVLIYSKILNYVKIKKCL